jgi:hypothetical protein
MVTKYPRILKITAPTQSKEKEEQVSGKYVWIEKLLRKEH